MFDRLQYISQGNTLKEQSRNIKSALDAGCRWIQLRLKHTSEEELRILAAEVKDMCRQYGAVFIMNDHVPIARETDADGIHLGLTDMTIAAARRLLGPDKIIGGTANTTQQVLHRIAEGCNYIGLGPFRFTTTKEKLSPVLGIEGYKYILGQLPDNCAVPVYAIGGILSEDIATLRSAGLYGVAVSGLITHTEEKEYLITGIKNKLYATTDHCGQGI